MIVQFLTYAFGILATFILFNLGTFSISKKLNLSLAMEFEETTQDWLTFLKDGIPVPVDDKRTERDFIGEPALGPFVREEVLYSPIRSQRSGPLFSREFANVETG